MYPDIHIFPLISLPLFIVFLCEYEASYRTAPRTVEKSHLFSCIFKHAYTRTRTLWKAAWLLVKGSLLKPAPGRESWSPAKQDSYKVEHGRPRHVCRDLKPLSQKLCLHFVHCSGWTVHRKAFSYPFSVNSFRFSLSLTRLLSDSWFNSCVLKEIMCLIGLLGVFFKWVLTHPHSPRLWILLWDGLSGTCFQTPQSAGWAWNGNPGVCYSLILLSHSNYNKYD